MAYPNEIIVGENIYNIIDPDKKEHFLALYDDQDKWNSVMKYNSNLKYHVYKYVKK